MELSKLWKVEAARVGLLVVSTDVGGVPEVLPDDGPDRLVTLAKPEVSDICQKLIKCINDFKSG